MVFNTQHSFLEENSSIFVISFSPMISVTRIMNQSNKFYQLKKPNHVFTELSIQIAINLIPYYISNLILYSDLQLSTRFYFEYEQNPESLMKDSGLIQVQ